MIQYAEALQSILQAAKSASELSFEALSLNMALGRVSAEAVTSPVLVPPFDNSAMDGFAVRSSETTHARSDEPVRLRVLGSVVAGDLPPRDQEGSGAWEIMTGAPFPEGFDACVRIEDVQVLRDADGIAREITLTEHVSKNDYRRNAGEDFSIGCPVISKGCKLLPEHLLAFSSLGISHLKVFRRPRIALISTGKELVELGTEVLPGQIRNSTSHYLLAELAKMGAEVTDHGIVRDEPSVFRSRMQKILALRPDIVITTGAVSMGKHDFIKSALIELGAREVFHKVAIRPGKPILFSQFERGPVVFGLPGNPVSTVVGLRFFVEPYIRELVGLPTEQPLRARLSRASQKPNGLRCFFKGRVRMTEAGVEASLLDGQMSFLVRPLLDSTAWVAFPEQGELVKSGDLVDFYPLHALDYDWSGYERLENQYPQQVSGECCK